MLKKLKICSIVGARPQFIKAAILSRKLRKNNHEILIHTGQHYDDNLSSVFFQELEIPEADYNLGVGSASHGKQTGMMLERIEEVLLREKPNLVLVYGDTNSTLAGALAAVKLQFPVGHVEAGLRSFNREMPEEINRVLTDHISNLLFCPTETSVTNLKREGINQGCYLVGDVMYDLLISCREQARLKSDILEKLRIKSSGYFLLTIHRPENTAHAEKLRSIFSAVSSLVTPVVFPAHPRTLNRLREEGIEFGDNILMIEPVSYLEMIALESNARLILTDSGGVQKEAYILKVPCVTLREETEWVETLIDGWNVLAGSKSETIIAKANSAPPNEGPRPIFGDGRAGEKIADIIRKVFMSFLRPVG